MHIHTQIRQCSLYSEACQMHALKHEYLPTTLTWTQTHTNTSSNTHTPICSHTHTHMHAYTHTYIHTYTHTHIHTRKRIHTQPPTHPPMNTKTYSSWTSSSKRLDHGACVAVCCSVLQCVVVCCSVLSTSP